MKMQLLFKLMPLAAAAPILFRRPDHSLGVLKVPELDSPIKRDTEAEPYGEPHGEPYAEPYSGSQTWTPPAVVPATPTAPSTPAGPGSTGQPPSSGINYRNPLGSGLAAAANVFADTIQSFGHALQNENSSPVLDTFYTAIGGVTKELSVAALTFRKILDPTDWDTVHTIGRLFSPIVNDATSSAQSVASKLEQYGLGGNNRGNGGSSYDNDGTNTDYDDSSYSSESHTDRLNGLRTYVNALRDLSTVAQTYDLDTTTLDATISRIDTVIKQNQ